MGGQVRPEESWCNRSLNNKCFLTLDKQFRWEKSVSKIKEKYFESPLNVLSDTDEDALVAVSTCA